MPDKPLRVLLVCDRPDAASGFAIAGSPWLALETAPAGRLPDAIRADAVLLAVSPYDAGSLERALGMAARLRDTPVPALVLDEGLPPERLAALYRAGVLGRIAPDEDPELVAALITGLAGAKQTAAHALRRLREHTRHLDEQLRLAQRLQMDFLPRRMPAVTGARFAARLEAAAWVAGDFYDIFRLDERHVGFYVADAVGHGIPAALLTVFVKKSLQTKRIDGKDYELIPPHEALRLLNVDLLSAELQETPFITMVYGIYDEAARAVTYARAGHPKPVLLGPKGGLELLDGEGPLLGIFPDAEYDLCRRELLPGERLLLYSDGAERVEDGRRANPASLFDTIAAAALLPAEPMLDAILDAVRAATGGHHLADDVTLLALEMDA